MFNTKYFFIAALYFHPQLVISRNSWPDRHIFPFTRQREWAEKQRLTGESAAGSSGARLKLLRTTCWDELQS